MNITDIELYSSDNIQPLIFNIRGSKPDDRYYIKNILGLDAEELIPKFYAAGLQTRPKFYDFGLKPRTIVINFLLNPNFKLSDTASDLRDSIYKMISASRTGKLTLNMNDSGITVAKTAGFITKFEADLFTNKPGITISIQCDDPMFRGINSVVYVTELVDANPVIIVDSLSTAPHGFALTVTFTGASATFTIQDLPVNPEWAFSVTPASAFASGDVLYLSSEKSNKYLYVVRSGVTTYLMDRISPTSIWPIIFPGSNSFHIPEMVSLDLDKVEFYPAYWGV